MPRAVPRPDVKPRYPHDTLAPVPARHISRGLCRVAAAGPTAGVGQSAVLAGAIVAHRVGADQLAADADLDGVADDGHLDLAAAELAPAR